MNLNKEETSQRTRHSVSVPDVATKNQGRNVVWGSNKKKKTFIILIQISDGTILCKDKDTHRKAQLWMLFPKLSDFTNLKPRKQNPEWAFCSVYYQSYRPSQWNSTGTDNVMRILSPLKETV